MLRHQDDRSPYLSSLRPSSWLVLQTEIVVFRLLISRRLQNGLTSCGTDILDHLLGSQKVNYKRGRSFCSSVFLRKVDNFTASCAVVSFSYFGLELRERFPHSR